jgi:tetratricopeptide (TPR) repeat protein
VSQQPRDDLEIVVLSEATNREGKRQIADGKFSESESHLCDSFFYIVTSSRIRPIWAHCIGRGRPAPSQFRVTRGRRPKGVAYASRSLPSIPLCPPPVRPFSPFGDRRCPPSGLDALKAESGSHIAGEPGVEGSGQCLRASGRHDGPQRSTEARGIGTGCNPASARCLNRPRRHDGPGRLDASLRVPAAVLPPAPLFISSRNPLAPKEAETLLRRSIMLYRLGGSSVDQARVLVKLADTFDLQGRTERAIETVEAALGSLAPEGNLRLYICARFNLAWYKTTLGEYVKAERLIAEDYQHYRRLREPWTELRLSWLRGRIDVRRGKIAAAERAFLEARDGFIAEGIGYDAAMISVEELAPLYLEQGRTAEVKRLSEEMLPIFAAADVHREAMAALITFVEAAKRAVLYGAYLAPVGPLAGRLEEVFQGEIALIVGTQDPLARGSGNDFGHDFSFPAVPACGRRGGALWVGELGGGNYCGSLTRLSARPGRGKRRRNLPGSAG